MPYQISYSEKNTLLGDSIITYTEKNPVLDYVRIKRYYYDWDYADGITDYLSIPEVDLVAGDTITFKLTSKEWVGTTNNSALLAIRNSAGSTTGSRFTNFALNADSANLLYSSDLTLKVDGVPKNSNRIMVLDGRTYEFEFTAVTDCTLLAFNGLYGERARFTIFDIDINAHSGNRTYPLNDNSPTIVNTAPVQERWDGPSDLVVPDGNIYTTIASATGTNLTIGKNYRIVMEYDSTNAAGSIDLELRMVGSPYAHLTSRGVGTITYDRLCTTQTMAIRLNRSDNGNTGIIIKSVSVKEIDPVTEGTMINNIPSLWVNR